MVSGLSSAPFGHALLNATERETRGKRIRRASRDGDTECVNEMLAEGDDPNARGNRGFTAMMNAAYDSEPCAHRALHST